MRRYLFSLLILVFVCACARSGEPNSLIKVSSTQLAGDSVFLARYQIGGVVTLDTLVLDKKGNGAFSSDSLLPQGIYMLYLSDGNYVDMLVGEDTRFSVAIDTTNMPFSVQFENAELTEAFHRYSINYFHLRNDLRDLQQEVKLAGDLSESQRYKFQQRFEQIDQQLAALHTETLNKYPGSMLEVFLKTQVPPTLSDSLARVFMQLDQNGQAELMYRYYSVHFFDDMNLSDFRTYYTPFIGEHLKTYLNKVLIQRYDSIVPHAMDMYRRASGSSETSQLMADYLLRYATFSSLMGVDNLKVLLADAYYLTPQAAANNDSIRISKIRREADKNRYCMMGAEAHNITLFTADTIQQNLYDLSGTQLTILMFYEPDCEHCRVRAPKVVERYLAYRNDPRVSLVMVCMTDDKAKWQQFVAQTGLQEAGNYWDPKRVSLYWKWFDTSSTPMIYVLDKNHRIIVKDVEPEDLDKVLQVELK